MKVFVIDLSRCNGCYNCQIACKDEHVGNDWTPYAKPQPLTGHFWLRIVEEERGSFPKVKVSYIPTLCNHCDEAPCIPACRAEAIYKRPDGLVIIDPTKCTGCGDCLFSCPYDAIYFNEALMIAQKCTGCAHLIDKGEKEPRCVEACPTLALKFGEENELASFLKETGPLRPELEKTKPRVRYLNLNVLKPFITGAIYDPEKNECCDQARVLLIDETTGEIRETYTDEFGDFWFKGLEPNRSFTIKIEKEGYSSIEIKRVRTETDVNLGDIKLFPSTLKQ
jgi:Fe-S-cluster-containing dehydrogenase component